MADVLTDEELAALRMRHRKVPMTNDGMAGWLVVRREPHDECLTCATWPCEIAGLLATVDARAARIRELEKALEATEGLLNEMHPHVQGHSHERCTRRTDFCITSVQVAAALRGDQ